MKITADVFVVPTGTNQTGAAEMVARNMAKFESAGLSTHHHAMGLNVQGEDTDVFSALSDILADLHRAGVPRVYSTVMIESRTDEPPSIDDKRSSIAQVG
jgi:uncharacterized protein (TIGR00106 family)